MDRREQGPALALRRLVNGYQVSQAIYVAATLGVADLLKDGPRSSDDIATATNVHPLTLYRLLRALSSVGVFYEDGDRGFGLTPLGDCLRADAPESVAGWAAFVGQPYLWNAWADLLHSVRSGQTAFRHLYGMDVFDYRASQPELNALFDRAMISNASQRAEALLAAYDFGQLSRLVDVGGGRGAFLTAVLVRQPGLLGVLFDQPQVVDGAERGLQAAGIVNRCQVVGGDFFVDALPEGADAYVLGNVLHDWENDQATAILRNCRRAISDAGKLLVIERELLPSNEGVEAKFSDLNMLVETGGQERTTHEYTVLLATAGFQLLRVIATASPWSIFEAVPVSR
jgi:hypothetical protein